MSVLTAGRGKDRSLDMTTGKIWKHIISFSIPLLLGNIFQMLYSTVDSLVVGRFVSKEALAAIGSTGSVVNTLVGFFLGFSAGASVVVSQYFGAKDSENLRKAVHTSVTVTLIMSIFMTALGIFLTPYLVKFMGTPADVYDDAVLYLTIYFGGVLGLMLYNIVAGILRAVGDSKRPFYMLVISSVLNVVLDLLFVLVFRMKVDGVAYATVLSQLLSAVLTLIVLMRTDAPYRLSLKRLGVDGKILKKIVGIGLPTALQTSITNFANVFAQSYVNFFGSDVMAGYTIQAKIDGFVCIPYNCISIAVTTFVGQNLGARQLKRAKDGVRQSLIISMVCTAIGSVALFLFTKTLVGFFTTPEETEVIRYGVLFIYWLTPFYLAYCLQGIYTSALRGAGDTKIPVIMMLISYVAFRQGYMFLMSKILNTPIAVTLGYPLGWVVCAVMVFLRYKRGAWQRDYISD